MFEFIKKFFGLKELGTNVKTEVIAGITTFLTMAYILIVNPMILSDAGIPLSAGLFATVLVASFSSIAMGMWAKIPLSLAPGMGLNAFFSYTMVLGMGMSWQTALGAVFVSGLIFVFLSLPVYNVREKIVEAVPKSLRLGVAAGIGLFLALIGMINAGIIVSNEATIVGFGGFGINFVLFIIGLLIASYLMIKKIKGALIISIVSTSLIALVLSFFGLFQVYVPTNIFAMPSFEAFLQLDIAGVFVVGMIAPIFALLFTDMFDSISTFMGVSKVAGLVDENDNPKNVGKALMVDGLSTTLSGLVGSSPGTAYIESASGIEEGGRSGLTAVVTGLLFLPFMFLSPLLGFIPAISTAPILVIVGFYMIGILRDLDWKNYEDSIPAFMAMLSIPFTYSISNGIILGFISYVLIKVMLGKFSDIGKMLWVIFALSCGMLLLA